MGYVRLEGRGEDQDVIDIDDDTDVEEVSEDVVYEGLEDRGRVGKAIRHNLVLIVALGGDKGCLPFVPFTDTDEVISTSKIKLSVYLGTS